MPTRPSTAIRVAAFWIVYAAIFPVVGMAMGMAPPSARNLVAGSVVTALSLLGTYAFIRNERSSMADVGAAWSGGSLKRFAVGFAIGLAMVALLVAFTRIAIGPVKFARTDGVNMGAVPLMVVAFIALSAGEELGFRGYPLKRLRTAFGTWPAQIVVALMFAAYHMIQGWPPVNALVGTTAGSVLFGVATIASGGLAFPIGIHAAWNVGSWMLGTKSEAGYWRMDVGSEPSFAVGAGVYLAVMAVAMIAIWAWMRRPSVTR